MNAAWNSAPVPSEARVIANLRQSNEKLREALQDETRDRKRKAFSAFWRGTVCGAILATAAFIGSAAWGETINVGRHFINGEPTTPSTITIAPSQEPGELAVITFVNRHVNQEEDDGSRNIATPDVAVSVRFSFDYNSVTGADRIDVVAPKGITCDPEDCGVTVMEGFTGTVTLYDWRGM